MPEILAPMTPTLTLFGQNLRADAVALTLTPKIFTSTFFSCILHLFYFLSVSASFYSIFRSPVRFTCFYLFTFLFSVNVFLSMLGKQAVKLVMHVGNCTAWNMEFSLMDKCPATKRSEVVTIPSIPFSVRLEQASMSLVQFSWTWSLLLSVSNIGVRNMVKKCHGFTLFSRL